MEVEAEENDKFIGTVVLTNDKLRELDASLATAFDNSDSPDNLVERLRSNVRPELLTVR